MKNIERAELMWKLGKCEITRQEYLKGLNLDEIQTLDDITVTDIDIVLEKYKNKYRFLS